VGAAGGTVSCGEADVVAAGDRMPATSTAISVYV
jgi:hypothetical protein